MIEILDGFLKKIDILRRYTIAQYIEEFRDIGNFTISVPIIDENKYLLDSSKQYYVLFETKRNGEDKQLLGIVDKITKNADSDYENEYTLTGRMAQFMFQERVVKGTFKDQTFSAWWVYSLLYLQYESVNGIFNHHLPIHTQLTDFEKMQEKCAEVSKEVTGGYAWDAIQPVLEQDNLGIIVEPIVQTETIVNKHPTNIESFFVYVDAGVDRRKGNADGNVAVIFSQGLSNIARTTYERNTENQKNFCYIAGEGEAEERKWYEIDINQDEKVEQNKWLGHRELWVDARDIQSEQDDKVLTDAEYEKLIKQRANEKAAEVTEQKSYEATLTEQNRQYVFGVDYNIGDWVTVIDEELGLVVDAQIVTVKHTLQGTGAQEIIDISFVYGNKEKYNIVEQISGNLTRTEYNEVNIKYLDNKRKTNETNIKDLQTLLNGYDFSKVSTENNTDTWFPVLNGKAINHRVVAATIKQANYWMQGSNRITCVRLSNDILVWFVKSTTPTTVDITTAAAKGYRSREYTFGFPIEIKTILFADCFVENNLNWENVEFKIHSISSTETKSHFWCQNSYSGLPLYWYYVFVVQV